MRHVYMKECMLFLRILTLYGLNWKRDPFPSAIHSYLLVITSPRYEIAFLAIDVHRPNISLLFPFDSTFNASYRGWREGWNLMGKEYNVLFISYLSYLLSVHNHIQ